MANIVVTISADDEQHEALIGRLSSFARVAFLRELSPAERAEELGKADVIISWSLGHELKPEEFARMGRLRFVQLLSAAANQVPFSRIPASVTVASNAGAYAEQMAEHVVAMILAARKNLIDRHDKLKQGIFDQSSKNRMLQDSNCVILGFGGIGRITSRLLRCFGVRIYGINRTGKTSEPVDFIGTLKDLEHALRLADIVVVSLPLTKSTRGLIGSRELGWMKDDVVLVNVARGDIIDEGALYERLKTHPNFIAAIDAWWVEPLTHGEFRTSYPFMELPNVIGSPHNSAIVNGSSLKATMLAIENVKRFLNNEPIRGIVDRKDYE